jgi:murein DD-endopeptidase MepM/ murein hydrolase activator NlpD
VPLDYASIMQASQGLVPDFQQQMMNEQQLRAQRMQNDQNQQLGQYVVAAKQRAITRQQQFEEAVQIAVHSGDPRAIQKLMIEFPEFAAQLKPGAEAMNQQGSQTNITQMGSIYARVQGKDFKGAAAILQKRRDADKAAGLDTSDDDEILTGLNSDDPAQQQIAAATVGIHLAALTGDKFGETYGKLNPTDKQTTVQKEYDWRVSTFGKESADKWLATQDLKVVPVQAGGSVFNAADFVGGGTGLPANTPTQTGGGDPASTGGLVFPVKGGTFGQGLGASRDGGARRHNGLDIDAPLGSPVSPILAGTVTQIGSDPKSGTFVKVRHADGSSSSYSHLGSVTVRQGDTIAPGQHLGTVGTTGNATGPVLHLVMRDASGKIVDPAMALRGPAKVKVEESKKVNGKTYFRIGEKWFDNPRGE